jgi:hypothetical protein
MPIDWMPLIHVTCRTVKPSLASLDRPPLAVVMMEALAVEALVVGMPEPQAELAAADGKSTFPTFVSFAPSFHPVVIVSINLALLSAPLHCRMARPQGLVPPSWYVSSLFQLTLSMIPLQVRAKC